MTMFQMNLNVSSNSSLVHFINNFKLFVQMGLGGTSEVAFKRVECAVINTLKEPKNLMFAIIFRVSALIYSKISILNRLGARKVNGSSKACLSEHFSLHPLRISFNSMLTHFGKDLFQCFCNGNSLTDFLHFPHQH